MKITRTKIALSVVVMLAVVVLTPAMGLTNAERDGRSGVVLDFGYWNTEWVTMDFGDGMDGYQALEKACELKGFTVTYTDDAHTQVYSINDQSNLQGKKWGMYTLQGGDWIPCDDPSGIYSRHGALFHTAPLAQD